MTDFKSMLLRAGLTKAKLARALGITPRSVSNWGNAPPPYAVAYIALLIAYNKVAP